MTALLYCTSSPLSLSLFLPLISLTFSLLFKPLPVVVVVDLPLLRVAVEGSDNPVSLEKPCQASLPPDQQGRHSLGRQPEASILLEVYRCVQLKGGLWYVGVFYIGDREGRGGVFRRLCVGMILGWDFYWFGVGRGCDVFLWGERVLKGRSWGHVDVLVCYGCVA